MATGDLVTLAQAQAVLGVTSDPNGLIAALISAVSTRIQNIVSYQFAQATYTKTFNGTGTRRMSLPDRPIVSVQSVTIDGVSIPAASPPNAGFVWDTKFLYLYGSGSLGATVNGPWSFSRGYQNVVVSYTAGFQTIPADVQQACLDWIAAGYARLGDDPTIKSLRAGDTQIDYELLVTKLQNSIVLMPPSIAATIMPYQRVAAA